MLKLLFFNHFNMKHLVKYLSISLLIALSSSIAFATDEDTQIEDELSNSNTEELSIESFQLKTFNSCDDLEKITGDYIKEYNKNNYGRYYYGGFGWAIEEDGEFLDEILLDSSADIEESAVQTKSVSSNLAWSASSSDYSQTNTQVQWVGESDIIKTDGKYIYYMADYYDRDLAKFKNITSSDKQKKHIYIIDANTLDVVKKLKLPKHFWGTKLYLTDEKLVVLASGRPTSEFQMRYWNSDSKTYTVIFDISEPKEAELVKVFMSEWNFSKSRLIWDTLYVISRKDNYHLFRWHKGEDDIVSGKVIPRGLEMYKTDDDEKQNVELKWKKLSYNVNTGYVSKCNSIEYILPEADQYYNYPSFNLISVIDIDDVEKPANTKVIFWNLKEIYMSLDNLYITNNFYKKTPFRCPADSMCVRPFYYGGTNHTLIHKLSVEKDDLEYQASTLVPGQALTQYSMDEFEGNFRILTKKWSPERSTGLYILDEDLNMLSSLTWLGKTEDFKSSRYIGDKLFLVTFKQIDPFFAIDLSNPEKPEVMWELKIPGFSTYLHPYDENHIIGLGYDTTVNKWGWTTTGGVKVDLYEINYDKKCGDSDLTIDEEEKCESGDYKWIIVKQKQSLTLWERWSSSEALNNPRMFMWNAEENTLLLPAKLYKNDETDIYKKTDFFQGLIWIDIFKSWIKEKYRVTHIDYSNLEEARKEDCAKYSQESGNEPECKELVDGTTYCSPPKYRYVPKYCYADSTIGEYMASKSWDYSNYFVKRTLWIGDSSYAISDKKITSQDLDTWVSDKNNYLK